MVYNKVWRILVPLYVAGMLSIVYWDPVYIAHEAYSLHVTAMICFLTGFLLPGLFLIVSGRGRGWDRYELPFRDGEAIRRFSNLMAFAAAVFSIIYMGFNGFEKFTLLNKNVDALDFRFIGLENVPPYLVFPMEGSRRLLFPLAILLKLGLRASGHPRAGEYLFPIIVIYFLISIINLDRGPVFVMIAVFGFAFIRLERSLMRKAMISLGIVTVVALAGYVVNRLQYNNASFSLADFRDSLGPTLINRIVLSPVKMAQGWIFNQSNMFESPLMLEHARRSVLWGGEYVSSRVTYSEYVAPVGLFGDTYRNFGFAGMFFYGALVGTLFVAIQDRIKRLPLPLWLAFDFIGLVLVLYIYYGNVTSLGPFMIAMFLLFAPMLVSRRAEAQDWSMETVDVSAPATQGQAHFRISETA